MSENGFTYVSTPFTRCAGLSKSCIDHVWIASGCQGEAQVGYDWFSDHLPLFCYFSSSGLPQPGGWVPTPASKQPPGPSAVPNNEGAVKATGQIQPSACSEDCPPHPSGQFQQNRLFRSSQHHAHSTGIIHLSQSILV